MKRAIGIVLVMLFFWGAAVAHADVNEILTFSNLTDEELYVELSVLDDSGEQIFDIYVLPYHTSVVDYWAETYDATYSACATGEISGADYGCIVGGIGDYYNDVYFDITGLPYTAGPSNLPEEWYVFDNPYTVSGGLYVGGEVHSSGGGGCFIQSLF